jgi:hypothetical protein
VGGALLLPGQARADKINLEVKVVEASTNGNAIDPKLKHMQNDFKHKGFAYSSYKLVSEKNVTVDLKTATDIPLPNGKTAKLTPESREKDGKITMHVEIPPLFDVRYSVGNAGTVFQGAGPNGHGQADESQVFLVIKHTAK